MKERIGTTGGAVLGTSTVTTFVESASGVAAGGRTGLTAVTTAVLFLLPLFLEPLFGSIPGAATGEIRKIDKMTWVVSALFVIRIVLKAISPV